MRIALTILLVASASGCQWGRSIFSMSSDSPAPFFGGEIILPNKLPGFFARGNDATVEDQTGWASEKSPVGSSSDAVSLPTPSDGT